MSRARTATGRQSPEDKDRGGAGPGEVKMAKGKSKSQDTRDNYGNRYYLLVNPRPGEGPRL